MQVMAAFETVVPSGEPDMVIWHLDSACASGEGVEVPEGTCPGTLTTWLNILSQSKCRSNGV